MDTDRSPDGAPHLPAGGGRMGALVRAYDWSQTPLGPIAQWTAPLRTAVDVVLQSPVPLVMLWGPQGIMIYNDAYSAFAGGRHPRLLGSPVLEGWPEVADFNRNVMDKGLRGQTLVFEAQHLVLHRHDRPEDVWMDLYYSPLLDERGQPAGVLAIVVEVTAQVQEEQRRRQAEHDLRIANERIQLALDAGAVIGTWLWDVPNDQFTADERFAQWFSLDPEQARRGLPLATVMESIHPDDSDRIRVAVEQALATGGRYTQEYRVLQRDGSYRWIEANGHCQLDADGKPLRFPGVLIDIDERKRAERERSAAQAMLREREAELARVQQIGRVGGLEVGLRDGFRNRRSPEYLLIHGLPPDAINEPHEDWVNRIHPDDREWVQQHFRDTVASAATEYVAEYRIIRPSDGETRWISAKAEIERDEDGAAIRLVGAHTDITELKRAQAELQQLNATLEHQVAERTRERDRIWNSSNELMALVGFDGTLKSVNPAWSRVFGWSEPELLARPYSELIHPDDLGASRSAIAALQGGEPVARYEDRVLHRDGSHRLVAWTAVPGEGMFYAIGRDMTEQRETEDALRQAQKMEAIGQLTGGIAHDFNNLLTGIIGSLDLLQTRMAQGRVDGVERYVRAAIASANRAAALTHRLLAFARRQPLDPRPIDLNGLIASLEDLLRRTIGEQIQLEIVAAAGLWLTRCDPNQLENALLNLVLNARDAMANGGKLTIETANAHLDSAYAAAQRDVTPGQYVALCVSDTGTGMPPAVMARAFDPFFTTKPMGQGTGLGLSMIYGFTKQSEGHVRIYSEVGKGTTVKLYLPRFRGEAEDADAPQRASLARSEEGEVVLVVEDEPVVRDLVVEVLRDLGYRVLECVDGPSGLRALQAQSRVDLLVTDVGLPGMDGRQLADQARAKRPDLRVLFITGYAENAAFAAGFLEPGMEMITKPFAVEVLAQKVREMLNR